MATARRSSAKLKAAAKAKRRILLIEDEPTLRRSMTDHLTRRGFAVDATSDSEAALLAAKAHVHDLVLVDLHLPRESGYEVCEALRNDLSVHAPIVMMGEATSPEARAFAEEAGANVYLTKPFTLHQLDAVADGLLRAEAEACKSDRGGLH